MWRDAPKYSRARGASVSGNTRSTTGCDRASLEQAGQQGRIFGTVRSPQRNRQPSPGQLVGEATDQRRRSDPPQGPTDDRAHAARSQRPPVRSRAAARDWFDDAIVGSTQPGEVRSGVVDHVRGRQQL